jgi:hypothetical protein
MPRDLHKDPKHDPRLHIPGWWQDSSGLILPTSAPRGIAEPPQDLPPELRPQPAPVALEQQAPAPTDQFFAYIDEELLGVEPSTPAEVRALVQGLPAEPSLVILASLTARVNQLGFRAREQLTVAEEFYGPGPLLDRLKALVRAVPSRRVFAEQQLLLLFWMIVCEAPDSDARELTPEQYRLLKGALAACSTVVGEQTRRLHSTDPGEWLGYFAQLSALYRHEMPLPPLARAQELFARSRDEIAREDHQYCPLDQWHRETYGLDIEEQLRLAFGLSALAQAFDQHRDAGRRVYLGPDVVEDFLVKARLGERRDQALALISATRPQLAAELGEEPHDSARAIWDATPFKRFPFLRCRDGGLILLSPKFIQSWFTEGFHFRSLQAAQLLDSGISGGRRDSHVQRYQNFTGRVYERYCLDLARSVHARAGLQAARVLGEQRFSASKRKRAGKGEKTSDVAIDIGHDLILIETTASRLAATGLRTGDLARITGDVDRAIIAKIKQLNKCINHLVKRDAKLPGVQIEMVKRIWPVIVSFAAVQQNPILWEYIDQRTLGALSQARVKPLTLLDPEEYELLCGLVQAGHSLPELLAAKTSPLYARADFAYWLTRDPQAPKGGPHRAKLVEDSFARATSIAVAGIDFTAHGQAA